MVEVAERREIGILDIGDEVICPICGRKGIVGLVRTSDLYNVNTYLIVEHRPSEEVCFLRKIHICPKEGAFGERPTNPLVRDLIVKVIDLLERNRKLEKEVKKLREKLKKVKEIIEEAEE